MGSCGGTSRPDNDDDKPAVSAPSTLSSTVSNGQTICVNPAQFVRELSGDLRDYYTIGKKLGGGIIFAFYAEF